MSATYENFGLSFMYPENWQLADESGEVDAGPKTVTVQSPSGGFWSLHVYQPASDPLDLANQVRLTMETEYEGLEAHPASEEIGSAKLIGYDMDFYCLDFVVTAQVRSLRVGGRAYVLFCQAESRVFDKLLPGFQARTVSLLRGL
jgi:hypothetical protein